MSHAGEPSPRPAGSRRQGRASLLRSGNLAVRLLCELGLLVALAVWGFHAGSGLAADLVLGLGAPLLAAAVWGWGCWWRRRQHGAWPTRLAWRSRCCCSRPVLLRSPPPATCRWRGASPSWSPPTSSSTVSSPRRFAMAFVIGVVLFVVVAGILDTRMIPWPKPRKER